MNHLIGLTIESLVAVLLAVTISYCFVLNKRLKRLRADEMTLKGTISELITATDIAERAIAGLKATVRDCDEGLTERLNSASDISARLDRQNAETYDLMKRLTRILAAGRPLQASLEPQSGQDLPAPATAAAPRADLRERSASHVRSVAAAAGAFAERAQSRIDGLAA